MMNLSRFLHSRSSLTRSVDVTDVLGFDASVFRAGFSTAAQNFSRRDSVWIQPYCIFKGKAALFVRPVPSTSTKSSSGDRVIERGGCVMLTFMPAIGERKYDNEKKLVFALSPTEVGSIISMGSNDSSEFFHDPGMLSSNAGQVRKSLSIKPYGDTGSGYFISLSVANIVQRTTERLSVPVTTAEFAVLKTACSFALPHIMGWNQLTSRRPVNLGGPPKADSRMPNLEWNK